VEESVSRARSLSKNRQSAVDLTHLKVPDEHKGVRLPKVLTLEAMLAMIEALQHGAVLHVYYILQVIEAAAKHFRRSPTVQYLTVPANCRMTVVGDIHGQLADLLTIFHLNGIPSPQNMYVFNGDLVDRGSQSCECAIIVLGFILLYPEAVFINRGNHEQAEVNERYGFVSECEYKYGMKLGRGVFDAFNGMFLWFPLVHVINKSVMVVHGGLIRRRGTTLQQINDIVRGLDHHEVLYGHPQEGIPAYSDKQREDAIMAMDLLWSDPIENSEGMRMNTQRGAGILFGADVVHQFLANNPGLRMVVRSHECIQDGYCIHFRRTEMEGKLVTVFSASNYHQGIPNKGAILIFPGADDDEDASTRCRVFTFTALSLAQIPKPVAPGMRSKGKTGAQAVSTPTKSTEPASIKTPGHTTMASDMSILSQEQKGQIASVIHRESTNMRRAFEVADLERSKTGDFSPRIYSSSLPIRPARRSGDMRDEMKQFQVGFKREMSGPDLNGMHLTGRIRVSQWVDIMTAVLPRLPWFSLRHEILGPALLVNGETPTAGARSSKTPADTRSKNANVPGRAGKVGGLGRSLSAGQEVPSSSSLASVGLGSQKEEVDYNDFFDEYATILGQSQESVDKLREAGVSNEAIGTMSRYHDVLETIFNFFDRDGSGRIEYDEFRSGCEVLNENLELDDKMTHEDMSAMMRLMDNDGDGIDLDEFMGCFQMCQEPTVGSLTTGGLMSQYENARAENYHSPEMEQNTALAPRMAPTAPGPGGRRL